MAELMVVSLEGAGSLVVEVGSLEAGLIKAGRAGRWWGRRRRRWKALASVVLAASALLAKLGEVKPSKICLACGIK